jgi:Zn-dependent peptidase ImmA (M78 family)
MRTNSQTKQSRNTEGTNALVALSSVSQTANFRNHRTHQSLLAELRSVCPIRTLRLAEAMRIAELQANKLRSHTDADELALPLSVVTKQPRLKVVMDEALGNHASGSSHWDGSAWIILLNAAEPAFRHRFSLLHEYKHIIDDRFRGSLYQPQGQHSSDQVAELVADYFAACALMPKRLIKRVFCEGTTNTRELADLFDVSEKAMRVRLDALGLVPLIADYVRPVLTNRYIQTSNFVFGDTRSAA